jgi:hypothetical protein
MLLGEGQRVEGGDARGFPAALDRKAGAQAASKGEFPIHDRKRSGQKKQITNV